MGKIAVVVDGKNRAHVVCEKTWAIVFRSSSSNRFKRSRTDSEGDLHVLIILKTSKCEIGTKREAIGKSKNRTVEGSRKVPEINFHVSGILEIHGNDRRSSASVGGGFFFYQKTDFLLLRLRWRHKLSDCVEDYLELCVVFAL
jgi:hypothetical protein